MGIECGQQRAGVRLLVFDVRNRTCNNMSRLPFNTPSANSATEVCSLRARAAHLDDHLDVVLDKFDIRLTGGAGPEDAIDAGGLESFDIVVGDNAADNDQHIILALGQQLDYLRAKRHVRAEDAQADDVDVLQAASESSAASAGCPCKSPQSRRRGTCATTLAPRSWPSNPGFATKMRILRSLIASTPQKKHFDKTTRLSVARSFRYDHIHVVGACLVS